MTEPTAKLIVTGMPNSGARTSENKAARLAVVVMTRPLEIGLGPVISVSSILMAARILGGQFSYCKI